MQSALTKACYTNDQHNAISKFDKMKVGALFMKMGSGKTITACEIVNRKPIDKVIWICPKSLVDQTKAEVEQYLNKPFEIRWYEEISASDTRFLDIYNQINEKTMIIADESLKIKNPKSKRTKRLLHLSRLTDYKLILNGTPMSKHALDIFTQMEFLSPKILGMNENEFKYTFLEFWEDKPNQVVRSHNLDYLSSLIKPYIYESDLFVDVKQKDSYITTYLSEESKGLYNAFKEDLLQDRTMDELRDYDFFSIITQFQRHYLSYQEHYDSLQETVERFGIEKAIVFNKFKMEQTIIAEQIDNVFIINGDVKDRQQVIDDFKQADTGLLCMTYQVGAFGFNLQFCDTIIFFSHQFDYALQEQAEYRIYRLGQNNDCQYYHMYLDTGLDGMIESSLMKKGSLNNDFKDVLNKKTGEELKKWLTRL